jgi:2-C-methyl-D-erythritol 4-phosphate cytidylyltransferase
MNFALIFAGGVGSRMNRTDKPKQFLEIAGKAIISLTIEKFHDHHDIDGIVVVCVGSHIDACRAEMARHNFHKVLDVVTGGQTAQESILEGLRCLKRFADSNDTVLVHDGVRPLIDSDLISRNIKNVETHGSSVTIVACHETVLFRQAPDDDKFTALERSRCAIARAPQCYRIDDLISAAEQAFRNGQEFVDTYSLMEHAGILAAPAECDHTNIKITTYTDFLIAKKLIEAGM